MKNLYGIPQEILDDLERALRGRPTEIPIEFIPSSISIKDSRGNVVTVKTNPNEIKKQEDERLATLRRIDSPKRKSK